MDIGALVGMMITEEKLLEFDAQMHPGTTHEARSRLMNNEPWYFQVSAFSLSNGRLALEPDAV